MQDADNFGFDPFGIARAMSGAQSPFIPFGAMFSRLVGAAHELHEAQIEYGLAIVKANREMLEALFNLAPTGNEDDPPSVAVLNSMPLESRIYRPSSRG